MPQYHLFNFTRLKVQYKDAGANWRAEKENIICWRTELSKKIGFLDIGVRQKLLYVIPAYTKHGFHPGENVVRRNILSAEI